MNISMEFPQIVQFKPLDYRTTSNIADYKSERNRYDTFITWTKSFIDTRKLALYGFYLSRAPDVVECAFCKVQIGNWGLGDNVLREHLRWSPSCPLINRIATDNIPIDPILFDAAIPKRPNNQILRKSLLRCDSQLESPPNESGQELFEMPLPSYLSNMKSPDFRKITDRLASFKEWPKSMKQKPKAMSDAGYFYCGNGDAVKCFSCGGGLRDWEEDDDPWEQHALHYENCRYLNEVKTTEFIVATKLKLNAVSKAPSPQGNDNAVPELSNNSTDNENDVQLCQICFDEERCAIFFPCMHVIACVQCSYTCNKCPICRSNITSVKRIYFS